LDTRLPHEVFVKGCDTLKQAKNVIKYHKRLRGGNVIETKIHEVD